MIRLLEMTATASVIILVVIAMRILLIHKLPKKVFKALWAVVVARLVLPFSFVLPDFSSLFVPSFTVDSGSQNAGKEAIAEAAKTFSESLSSAVTIQSVLLIVWLCGTAIALSVFIFSYIKMRTALKEALPFENRSISPFQKLVKTKRTVTVKFSDRITSPLTYGIFKPVILFPKSLNLTDENRIAFIIAHEMTHIRRFDVLYKAFLTVAVCLHWFNPLVWVMYFLANRDIELACDEEVVKLFNGKKAEYAMALIQLEERRSHALTLGFSANAASERITAIMKFGKTSIVAMIVAFSLFFGTMVFAIGGGNVFRLFFNSNPSATEALSPNDDGELSENAEADSSVVNCTKISDSGISYNAPLDISEFSKYGITYSNGNILYNGVAQKRFGYVDFNLNYIYNGNTTNDNSLTIVKSEYNTLIISESDGNYSIVNPEFDSMMNSYYEPYDFNYNDFLNEEDFKEFDDPNFYFPNIGNF